MMGGMVAGELFRKCGGGGASPEWRRNFMADSAMNSGARRTNDSGERNGLLPGDDEERRGRLGAPSGRALPRLAYLGRSRRRRRGARR